MHCTALKVFELWVAKFGGIVRLGQPIYFTRNDATRARSGQLDIYFRRNAIAFRAIGIGFGNVRSFVRHEISSSNISKTISPRITRFLGDIYTDIVYSHTGYDVIFSFRSAPNRTNV